jgi:hypothetical protein
MTEDSNTAHIRPQKRTLVAALKPSDSVAREAVPTEVSARAPRIVQPLLLPKGILKQPKYSSNQHKKHSEEEEEVVVEESPPMIWKSDEIKEKQRQSTNTITAATTTAAAPTSTATATPSSSSLAIDGYTPKTDSQAAATSKSKQTTDTNDMNEQDTNHAHYDASNTMNDDTDNEDVDNDDEKEEEEPLIFNSLSDLMKAAGTLPPQDESHHNASVIEADLSFKCMDPDTFRDYKQMKDAEYYEACLGRPIVGWGDGSSRDDETDENSDPSRENDDDEGGDGLLFGEDDDEEESEDEVSGERRPPRSFLVLWNAISAWVTPQAVEYIRRLYEFEYSDGSSHDDEWSLPPLYDTSDIGASRCIGLQALLKLHCQRCWQKELQRDMADIRVAEKRLGELLRCMDYSQPMPKLSSLQAKAMACVLLETVMPCSDSKSSAVPDCCMRLDMTMEEYKYLSQSAIINFGTPSWP